jgi:hypothetical protein
MRKSAILIACSVLAAPIWGQASVSGTVLAPGGAGLAGCDLDFFDSATGVAQTLVSGDITGAGGAFLVGIPPGTYDLLVLPPPGTPILPEWALGVAVSTLTDVGTIQLDPGVLLSGTLANFLNAPVGDADIDVEIAATGESVTLQGDTTEPTGFFEVAVPATRLHIFFDPEGALGPTLVPHQIRDLTLCADTSLGTVTLGPGFVLSASVFGGLLPIANADLDVRPAGGGPKLFTPGDNSDANGFVDVVVPAGTYEVSIGAPIAAKRVATVLPNVLVAGTTSLGPVLLPSGQYLMGTVTDSTGQPIPRVDLDVEDEATGEEVETPNDDTDAMGHFKIVVPAGTYTVEFDPAPLTPYESDDISNVTVTGDTTLDAVLPGTSCTLPAHYGTATPGTGGVAPTIETSNYPRIGTSSFRLIVRSGLGGAFGVLAFGAAPANLSLLGGTLLVDPTFGFNTLHTVLTGPSGAACVGSRSFPMPIPNSAVLVGGAVYFQAATVDPAAPEDIAFTDGLEVVVCS